MRGLIGGMLTGGLVSVFGLGVVSVVSEQPAGITPPDTPLVQAPMVDPVETEVETAVETGTAAGLDAAVDDSAPSTPVGSVTIQEPQAPDLPEGEAAIKEPDAPTQVQPDTQAPRADTDPLDLPDVSGVEGAMQAPDAPETAALIGEPVAPVLPNPQSLPPQTPANEADLTVSTTPAQPIVVIEPDAVPEGGAQAGAGETAGTDDTPVAPQSGDGTAPLAAGAPDQDFFVVDLGADAAPDTDGVETPDTAQTPTPPQDDVAGPAPADPPEDPALGTQDVAAAVVPAPQPRVQLGGANTLLNDRDTGVTVRRPTSDADTPSEDIAAPPINALAQYSADAGDIGAQPLMSVILIDDGAMSAAAAALAGLPFPVTIAIDPALPNARDLVDAYRADGFEVAVLVKVPEGAVPSDVEITFESVFSDLPETIAVLDIGEGGLQSDRGVTEQAMDILGSQGRGFITVSQGLNMAGRAAEQAGVPAAVVYRDLDIDGQDARVVRRFVDQAAFRARQESGVVLVGRVRPDTISALILWGTANQDDQVAVVPVSAVLLRD